MQTLTPHTIADTKKSLLTGTWHGCPLRGFTKARPIEIQMFTTNHWTKHRDPNEGIRRRTEGAEGICNPIGRTTISTNQTLHPPELPGTKQPIKEYTWRNPGSCSICSRGWPCQASMGGEALGTLIAQCPCVGLCQGGEVGVGGVWM